MRLVIITFSLLLLSLPAIAQELIVADKEGDVPIGLYKKANELLTIGNTKLAINIFEKVIDFYEQEGRLNELPENYLGMALSFALNGHYPESIRYHKKALRAHRRYKSKEPAEEIMINLGLAYRLAGKEKKAKRYLN
jgi:tetratricopeptide (TPR) repeat protein